MGLAGGTEAGVFGWLEYTGVVPPAGEGGGLDAGLGATAGSAGGGRGACIGNEAHMLAASSL